MTKRFHVTETMRGVTHSENHRAHCSADMMRWKITHENAHKNTKIQCDNQFHRVQIHFFPLNSYTFFLMLLIVRRFLLCSVAGVERIQFYLLLFISSLLAPFASDRNLCKRNNKNTNFPIILEWEKHLGRAIKNHRGAFRFIALKTWQICWKW